MEQIKNYLPWTVRIIIFSLFMLSGIAKMFPIWSFEKQLVDLGISSWCFAPYLSRGIIALEIALAIAILQNHYIKKIVIPVTIFLLVAFCFHLSIEMVKHGAMSGNCGCFGELIPMTPLEAFIKNIFTLGLLVYLYKKLSDLPEGQNKFSYLSIIFLASTLLMFVLFPFCPCEKEKQAVELYEHTEDLPTDSTAVLVTADTIIAIEPVAEVVTTKPKEAKKELAAKPNIIVETEAEPEKQKSKFAEFTLFGKKQVNIDQGKKIIALFAPGCDHCKETAKELCHLANSKNFPEVYILFMDEEIELIPAFFKDFNCKFPFQVLDISKFWKVFGKDGNTPGVSYLWNGNIMKFYEGIHANKFDATDLKKQIETKYNK